MAAIQGILSGVSKTSWTNTQTNKTTYKLHLYITKPFDNSDYTLRSSGCITTEILIPDEDLPTWEDEVFNLAEKTVRATYTKNKYNQNVLGFITGIKK